MKTSLKHRSIKSGHSINSGEFVGLRQYAHTIGDFKNPARPASFLQLAARAADAVALKDLVRSFFIQPLSLAAQTKPNHV